MLKLANRAIFEHSLLYFIVGISLSLFAIAVLIAFSLPDFLGSMSAPITWTVNDFRGLTHVNPVYNVNTTANMGFYLDATTERTSRGDTITQHFGLIRVGDQYIITRNEYPLPSFQSEQLFRGTLRRMDDPENDPIFNLAYNQIPPNEANNLQTYIFTVAYETTQSSPWWSLILIIPMGIMALIGLYVTLGISYRFIDPTASEIWKTLKRFGAPQEKVITNIEADFANGIQRIGSLRFGSRWLVYKAFTKFEVMRISEIVWAKEQINVSYGIKFRHIELYDRHGQEISVNTSSQNIKAVLNLINKRVPWAIIGTDTETDDHWLKNRWEFIREVGQRRQQYLENQKGLNS